MRYLSLFLLSGVLAAQTNEPPEPYRKDPLNLYQKEPAPPDERILVLAINVPQAVARKGDASECPGGLSCKITKYVDHWTCAEGKRVLLNSEDGTEHWCLKLPASTK